jgi:acetyl esterase/lipase
LPWQMMDVYVPRELAPEKIEGAIMFIHGGAWIGGGRIEQQAFAKRMAKKGYLTGNMEYMLFNDSLKEHKKDYNIQRVLTDVDLALAKLVEIGESYGYKINRVALSGHSAGGHISMLYGYTYETREGGDPPVKIAFVAPRVGPVDFHAKTWNAEKEPKTMAWFASFLSGVKMSPKQYANPDDATEAAIQSISPLYAIKPGVPPTLAAYGAKDALVPERHWQLLRHEFSKIKAKSIADLAVESDMDPVIEGADPSVFDLLVFPNSNHMLGRDPDYTLKWRGLFLAYATRYLDVPAKPDVNLPEKTAPEEEPVLVTNQ